MAASGFTPISLYYSTTAAAAPVAGNLVSGELAINITDGKLYYKDNAGVVKVIAGAGGAGIAGGSNTQVQFNSSGNLAGSANMTFNGTTLTVADLTDSSLTVNRVVYAGTGGNLVNSANLTFDGTTLTPNALTVTGATALNGGTTIGDASGDALTINSSAVSIPNGLNFDSNTLVIDATNNRVGVGTASPGYALDVVTSGIPGGRITTAEYGQFVVTDGTRSTYIQNYAGLGLIGTSSNNALAITTNSTERMRIDSSGNLLLGTTSAVVTGFTIGAGSISLDNNRSLNIKDSGGTSESVVSLTSGNNVSINAPTSSGSMQFNIRNSSGAHQFVSGGTERMRITSTGNVGIGTSSPTTKLDIRGSSVGGNFSAISIDNNAAGSGSPANTVSINFSSGGSVKDSITGAVYGDGYLAFATNDNTEKMRLTAAGNLGIGTSSPSQKLTVVSNDVLGGILVTGANAPGIRINDTSDGSAYSTIYAFDGGVLGIGADESNTAANSSIQFKVDGTERMRLDSSGNLGLGVTPSNASAAIRSFEFGQRGVLWATTSSSNSAFATNANLDSSANWVYKQTGTANAYQQDGIHRWLTAPSGTAGNAITFTQAMTLDASGNLGIGTTSPSAGARLHIKSSGSVQAIFETTSSSAGYQAFTSAGASPVGAVDFTSSAMIFYTGPGSSSAAERLRIGTAGQLGIGGANYGTSGQALVSNGAAAAPSWQTVSGGQYFGTAATKAIAYNSNSIAENITVTAGNNGLSAGPITISSGFTVTVQTGAVWVIV